MNVVLASYFLTWINVQALERLSFAGSEIKETVVAQSRILLFWYCTTYLLLEKNKPKYQPLEAPSQGQVHDQVLPTENAEDKEEQPISEQVEGKEQSFSEQVEQPFSEQVEGKEQLEPQADQIQPFFLEGL